MTNTTNSKSTTQRVVTTRPRTGTIKSAISYSGIGHSKLYEKAGVTPGLFLKWDGRTLVDFDVLDGIIDNLPQAEIKGV